MVFELEIDTYFWMVDRAEVEDDQRNQVNIEKQKVVLYKDHSARIENGVYMGKIMHAIRKTILKKSRKPFTLDPALANLKDQSIKSVKEFNWTLVITELKKFNIKTSKEKKQQIIDSKSQSAINEMISKLMEYDNNLKISTGGNDADNYRVTDEKPDANSEINYGYRGGEYLEKKQFNPEADSQRQVNQYGGQPLNGNTKSTAILLGAPTKKNTLEPLDQFKNNQLSVPNLGARRRQNESFDLNLSADINPSDINLNGALQDPAKITDLRVAQNSVMFIFSSLKKALEMSHNQVGGLLANQYKFLVLICVKGMKGADYSKVIAWYQLLFYNADLLVDLLSHETEQIKTTLDVIKCGLFSKNAEVATLCSRLFIKIVEMLNEFSDTSEILDLKFVFYEWLTLARVPAKITPAPSPYKGRSPAKPPKKLERKEPQDNFMYEQGLKAFIRAYKRGNPEYIESFAIFLIKAGQDSLVDLISNHLRGACENTLQYLEVIQDIKETFFNNPLYKAIVIQSGVLNVLIDILIQIADSQQNQNQFNDSYAMEIANQQNNEKQRALMLLVDFWRGNPQIIQSQDNAGRTTEAIMGVLKKGCRDRSKAISILSMNLMFSLLDSFAADRNKYAPILYKALTFIMVDSYGNLELREEMLNNFINLFTNIPSMPIQILCDPLFKQIQINLEKQNSTYEDQNLILNNQSEHFNLNTTDMKFFMHIAIHPKLHANVAIQLLQIVTEISRKNIIFTRISLKLILTILNRFENNTAVFEFCQLQIRSVMKIIQDQDGIKVDLYNLLIRDPKNRVFLQKRKTQIAHTDVAQTGNKAEFSNVVSKNTINTKMSVSPGKDHLQKLKGITAGQMTSTNLDFIDDTDVQQVLNPALFVEESTQYLSIRTQEKMIVNQLQCFINTGIKVLVDYIRQELIETYIKIEKKYKFKNKGLLYLLALYEKDVTKMLQYYYNEQTKAQKDKIKAKKQQKDKELQEQRRLEAGSDLDLDDSHHFSLEDLNDRAETLKYPSLKKPKQSVPNTLVVPKPKLKSPTKIKTNRNSQNVISNNDISQINITDEAYSKFLQQSPNAPRAKSTSVKSLRNESENGQSYQKRSLGEPVGVKALSVGRAKEQIQLFDILQTNDFEVQKYVLWMKDHLKLYKAMFHKYATVSANKINIRKVTFDDIKDQQNTLSLTDVFSFLNDFKILQTFGQSSQNILKIKRDDIKSIIKMINLKNAAHVRTQADLDVTGFIEFVLQIGHFTHDRSIKPSIFLPSLFDHFKRISLSSKQPLFQRLFQDPHATSIGNSALIQELTNKLNEDEDYPLPPGYIKYRVNEIEERYEAPREVRKTSYKISLEILDDILFDAVGVHHLNPEVDSYQRWGVKPDIFQQQLKKKTQASYSKIGAKHTYQNPNELQSRNESQSISSTTVTPQNKSRKPLGLKKNFQVNSSVDLGIQRRKPPSSLRKKVNFMQSSLEPQIGVDLKIQLANQRDYRDQAGLKEAALMMEDMLRSVEQQPGGMVIRGRLVDAYNNASTQGRRGQQQNKFLKAKQEKQNIEKQENLQKAEQKRIHDEKLKRKLENYAYDKQQQQKQKDQDNRNKSHQKNQEERRKTEKKKQLYERVRADYEETKLPELQLKAHEAQDKKIKERETKQINKERANEKTQQRIQSLMRDFQQKKQFSIEEEDSKKKKDNDYQRRLKAQTDKNSQHRTTIAQRYENEKRAQAERSVDDTASKSPERAQGNRLKSGKTQLSVNASNKASNKSPQRGQSIRKSATSVPKQQEQADPYQLPNDLGDTGEYSQDQFHAESQVQQEPQQAPPQKSQASPEVNAKAKSFWGKLGLSNK